MSRCLLSPLLVAAAVSAAFAQGKDGLEGTRDLTSGADSERENIDSAIRMLDGFANAFVPDDKGPMAGRLADQRFKKEMVRIVEKLKKTVKERIVTTTEPSDDFRGGTTKEGGPDDKIIVINSKALSAIPDAVSECSAEFVDVMDTLVHEGVHLDQQTSVEGEDSDEDQHFEHKLSEMEFELNAYRMDFAFILELRSLVVQMQKNVARDLPANSGLSGWADPWASCSAENLNVMKDRIEEIYDSKFKVIKVVEEKFVDKKTGKFIRDRKILEENFKDDISFVEFIRQHLPPVVVSFSSVEVVIDYSEAAKRTGVSSGGIVRQISFGPGGDSYRFEGKDRKAGVDSIQDVRVIAAADGSAWVLVAGHMGKEPNPGIVRAVPLDPKAKKEAFTIVEKSALLRSATSLVVVSGSPHVYSPVDRAVYRLEDTDQDGVPDQMNLGSILQLPQSVRLYRAPFMMAWNGDLVALPRFLVPDFSSSPWIFISDPGGDGVYEQVDVVDPRDFASRRPAFLADLVPAATTVGISGVRGHALAVVGRTPQGQPEPLAQVQIPPGGEDFLVVNLSRPLRAQEFVEVRDLTNQRTSDTTALNLRQPVVWHVSNPRIDTDNGSPVRFFGEGFENVQGVVVDGVPAQFQIVSPQEIVVQTPALTYYALYAVEFVQPGGTLVRSARDLYPSDAVK